MKLALLIRPSNSFVPEKAESMAKRYRRENPSNKLWAGSIVIYSNDSETVWNGFWLGLFSLQQGDSVSAFLLAKGVEYESLDTARFKVTEQMQQYLNAGGNNLACGTCLKLRNNEGSDLCQVSTMKDLYELICDADKIVTL